MEKIQITVADEHTKGLVLRLLHSINGVTVLEHRKAISIDPAVSIKSLAGIWKGRDISLQQLREKAWKRISS
jgi:hypothetical protein